MINFLIQNSDNQLFGQHLDPPEPLELSLEPDLGYPPPDPLFKTTVQVVDVNLSKIENTSLEI